jgi:uncharacterized RDD family membrane protein YckC
VRRIVAAVIDPLCVVLVLGVADEIVSNLARGITAVALSRDDRVLALLATWLGGWVMSLCAMATLVVPLGLAAWEAATGATPGKWLVRLRVLDRDGRPPTRRAAARRWAVKYAWVWAMPVLLLADVPRLDGTMGAASLLWLASTLAAAPALWGRRALHDLVAGTTVAARPRRSGLEQPPV